MSDTAATAKAANHPNRGGLGQARGLILPLSQPGGPDAFPADLLADAQAGGPSFRFPVLQGPRTADGRPEWACDAPERVYARMLAGEENQDWGPLATAVLEFAKAAHLAIVAAAGLNRSDRAASARSAA